MENSGRFAKGFLGNLVKAGQEVVPRLPDASESMWSRKVKRSASSFISNAWRSMLCNSDIS